MKIREFGVEIWMNRFETKCELNLAETCVESLSVAELLTMAGKTDTVMNDLLPMTLTYGAIEGSDRLRALIAELHERQSPNNVLVTHGAIGANALVHQTLVEPCDRVISVLPTYQQHYSIPESYGADVKILRLREENAFLPDLDELRALNLLSAIGITVPKYAFTNSGYSRSAVSISVKMRSEEHTSELQSL